MTTTIGAPFFNAIKMHPKPIITTGEARKILGPLAKELTNEELESLIYDSEQMIRILLRAYMVHKSEVVE